MTIDWKRNLYIAWLGCFFTGASFSLVMPFIPVYIEQLGAPLDKIEFYSGLAISLTALASGLIAPVWGNLADRKGRKLMMVRAAFGMTLTMGALAFVPNVFWLLVMRFMTGVLSGYVPNATAMIAAQAPPEKNGWAIGTLATGTVAGSLIAPMIGGYMAEHFGMENVFIITGIVLLITTLLTVFFVQEDFTPIEKKDALSRNELMGKVRDTKILYGLFATTLILQLGMTSITPILTLYIRELGGNVSNILFVSGMIVSVSGVSAFLSSPLLGKLGDKYGNQNILLGGLVLFFMCILPMAFVKSPFELGVFRFLMGFSTGALMPSINSIISKLAPKEGVSRIFSYNQMCQNFGQVLGPLVGSSIASGFGYSSVFIGTAGFIALNICLTLYNFKGLFGKKIKFK